MQVKWLKRLRKHGFRSRNSTSAGKRVLARRRQKGRAQLAVFSNRGDKRGASR